MNKKEFNRLASNKKWKIARQKCCLSEEAVKMAQELNLNPLRLISNVPTKKEPWKKSSEVYIRKLYSRRFGGNGLHKNKNA